MEEDIKGHPGILNILQTAILIAFIHFSLYSGISYTLFLMKRSSVSLVFNIFLVIGGVILIVGSVLSYKTWKFTKTAEKTTGKVVDLITSRSSSGNRSTTYKPVVIYVDNNGRDHRYIASFSSNPPAYEIGEWVDLYYDPANPGEAQLAGWGEYLGGMIAGALGLVFTCIGGGYHIIRKVKNSNNARLKESGQLVSADLIAVDINRHFHVNNRHPFFLRCEWKDTLTGQLHTFKSGFIWNDPTPLLNNRKRIDVYIDPNNPGKYYVDITPYE